VGIGSAQTLKILERVTIETVILLKGRLAAGGGLRGEKRYGLKPLFSTPKSYAYMRSWP
jgi:hypothetical protein